MRSEHGVRIEEGSERLVKTTCRFACEDVQSREQRLIEPASRGTSPSAARSRRFCSCASSLARWSVSLPWSAERELSFEAVGCDVPYDLPGFLLYARFNAGDPVCTIVEKQDTACSWLLGLGRIESETTVAPSLGVHAQYVGAPNGRDESEILPGIPEESWPEAQAALSK